MCDRINNMVVNNLEKFLYLFGISMVPLIELRGAMIYAAANDMPFLTSFICCVLGNILPVPFLIKFSKGILFSLSKVDKIGWVFQKIIDRGNKKAAEIGGWELLGLFLFVAVPLPGTGAWTASLVSALLQLRIKKCLLAIGAGVVACGLIMGALSFGIANIIA